MWCIESERWFKQETGMSLQSSSHFHPFIFYFPFSTFSSPLKWSLSSLSLYFPSPSFCIKYLSFSSTSLPVFMNWNQVSCDREQILCLLIQVKVWEGRVKSERKHSESISCCHDSHLLLYPRPGEQEERKTHWSVTQTFPRLVMRERERERTRQLWWLELWLFNPWICHECHLHNLIKTRGWKGRMKWKI